MKLGTVKIGENLTKEKKKEKYTRVKAESVAFTIAKKIEWGMRWMKFTFSPFYPQDIHRGVS